MKGDKHLVLYFSTQKLLNSSKKEIKTKIKKFLLQKNISLKKYTVVIGNAIFNYKKSKFFIYIDCRLKKYCDSIFLNWYYGE